RFIKLPVIRKVLAAFLAKDPVTEVLMNKDFHSVAEVLEAVGQTRGSALETAQQVLEDFQPALILNRMRSKSRINTLHLQHLLKQYVGANLSVLGKIPEDDHVQQSISKFLPVVELAPASPAAMAFDQLTENVLEMIGMTNESYGHITESRKKRA